MAFSARPPKVAVERVLVNGRQVADNSGGARQLRSRRAHEHCLHFAALCRARQTRSVRYRIGGAQRVSPVQAERDAVFEWLPAGRYALG
jgi:hypothetical protein